MLERKCCRRENKYKNITNVAKSENSHLNFSLTVSALWADGKKSRGLCFSRPWLHTSLSFPTHHILEFHLGNWLLVLHLSLPEVGILSPSLMERHSHFQSELDERERSGVLLRGNRFCIPGFKGLQRCLVNLSRWEMSWDGFLLGFLAPTHKDTDFTVQVFAQTVVKLHETVWKDDFSTCWRSQNAV